MPRTHESALAIAMVRCDDFILWRQQKWKEKFAIVRTRSPARLEACATQRRATSTSIGSRVKRFAHAACLCISILPERLLGQPKSLSNSLWVPIQTHSTVLPWRCPTARTSRVTLTVQTSVWPRSFLNCKELCPGFVENRRKARRADCRSDGLRLSYARQNAGVTREITIDRGRAVHCLRPSLFR